MNITLTTYHYITVVYKYISKSYETNTDVSFVTSYGSHFLCIGKQQYRQLFHPDRNTSLEPVCACFLRNI